MEEYNRTHLIVLCKEWEDPEISWQNPGEKGGRTTVKKFWLDLHDFEARQLSETTYETFDYTAALEWCAEHHYTVVLDNSVQTVIVHDSCPDRIDFAVTDQGIRATHMDRRGERDIPRESFFVDLRGRDLYDLSSWLDDHGYNSMYWTSGARAFRGTPWPIRTRAEIYHMRRKLEERVRHLIQTEPGTWHGEEELIGLDLAYAG